MKAYAEMTAPIMCEPPPPPLKLIYSVESIFPPLTGIGRYAMELATRLPTHSGLEEVRFFSMGRWVDDLNDLLPDTEITSSNASASSTMRRLAVYLRKSLAKRTWAVNAYSLIVPGLSGIRLRPFEDHLFHSPSFFVPDFHGRSIATIHDLSNYRYPELHPTSRRKIFDLEIRRTLDSVSHIITDSESIRSEVIAQFAWPASRITAIPLGVSQTFAPRPAKDLTAILLRHGLQPQAYSLCVSTLEPRKKVSELIEAYGGIPGSLRTHYPLVIVGSLGWLNDTIMERIERGRREGWLRYLGYVPNHDLPALYAGAHAFLYPSVYEGFGLPVLEAMASGTPVLTSCFSCLPEVSAGAGILVDPDDHVAFRDAIQALLTDDTWRQQARARGLCNARSKTWDRCAHETVELYRSVMAY